MKRIAKYLILIACLLVIVQSVAEATWYWSFHSQYNGNLQVWGTRNSQRNTPDLYNGPYTASTWPTGWVPTGSNDYSVRFVASGPGCTNRNENYKVTYKRYISPLWEMVDFEDWLTPYTPLNPLRLPYLIDMRPLPPNGNGLEYIYTAWDLDKWLLDPRLWYLGQNFQIVDGISPDLPGLQFGRAAFVFNPYVGPDEEPYLNPMPFTGVVQVAGEVAMAIPEPATMFLLAAGLFGIRKMKR